MSPRCTATGRAASSAARVARESSPPAAHRSETMRRRVRRIATPRSRVRPPGRSSTRPERRLGRMRVLAPRHPAALHARRRRAASTVRTARTSRSSGRAPSRRDRVQSSPSGGHRAHPHYALSALAVLAQTFEWIRRDIVCDVVGRLGIQYTPAVHIPRCCTHIVERVLPCASRRAAGTACPSGDRHQTEPRGCGI